MGEPLFGGTLLLRSLAWNGGVDTEIVAQEYPSRIARFFGAKPRQSRFVGSATVWHNAETGEGVGDYAMQAWLYDRWMAERRRERVRLASLHGPSDG